MFAVVPDDDVTEFQFPSNGKEGSKIVEEDYEVILKESVSIPFKRERG